VNGPFETEREAREAVRHIRDLPPGTGAWTEGNQRLLTDALTAAGVALGAYDHRILDWLTGWEPQTLAVIAGWVTRANHEPGSVVLPPGALPVILWALADAKWARVHEGVGCDECDVAEAAERSPDSLPACPRHKPDVERAEVYDQAAHWLAGAAGVPEAALMEVNEDHPSIERDK
jgi:hypothetical protein